MAITYVGASTFVTGTTSPQTATLPSNLAAGDFLLCLVSTREDSPTPVHSVSGWTQTGSTAFLDLGTSGISISAWYKFAVVGESGPSVSCTTPLRLSCHVLAFRGVDQSSPFDGTTAQGTNAAAATFTPPNITTNTAKAWVVTNVSTADDNALNLSTAQGFTEQASGAAYDETNVAHGSATKEFASTGSQTLPTWNQTVNGNDAWAYITVALKPGPRIEDSGSGDPLYTAPQPIARTGPEPFTVTAANYGPVVVLKEPTNDVEVVVQAHAGGPAVAILSASRSPGSGAGAGGSASVILVADRAAAAAAGGGSSVTTTVSGDRTTPVLASAGPDAKATMQSDVVVDVTHALGPAGATSAIEAAHNPAATARGDVGAASAPIGAPNPAAVVPADAGAAGAATAAHNPAVVSQPTTGSGGSSAGSGDRAVVARADVGGTASASASATRDAIVQAAVAAALQAEATVTTDVYVSSALLPGGLHGVAAVTVTRSGVVQAHVGVHGEAAHFVSILDTGDQAEVFRLPIKVIRRGPTPREITVPVHVALLYPPSSDISVVVVATVGGNTTAVVDAARSAIVRASGTGAASEVEASLSFADVAVSAVLGAAGVDAQAVVTIEFNEVTVDTAPLHGGVIATIDARAERSIISHLSAGVDADASNLGAVWYFRPPTEERVLERMPRDPGNRLARDLSIGVKVGITVYKLGDGSYTTKWSQRLDIVRTYHGGHIHLVDETEANALIAAGYGGYVTLEA